MHDVSTQAGSSEKRGVSGGPGENGLGKVSAVSAQTETQTEAQRKLHDLLATMWEQRKSTVQEWVRLLQESVSSLQAPEGNVSAETARKSGSDVAHKLAGILGTFGLPRGTDLARQAEVTMDKEGPLSGEDLQRLRGLTEELAQLIDQRSLPTVR
jgi:HPt (histidine-containing phosphotransfer) domain-containing protein